MQTVSDAFRQAPTRSHTLVTTLTLTTPGGASQTLALSSGTVSIDRTQQVRRTAPNLAVKGGMALYDLLSVPGAAARIDHGYAWSGAAREQVPIITGPVTTASLPVGDGLVSFALADRWQALAAMEYLTPFTPAATAKRTDVIIAAVQDAFPGIAIRNSATDTGLVATAQAWSSRTEMIASLATDGGTEVYFDPDGGFVLRNLPKITDSPAWLIKSGPGGTLKTITRSRPLDKLFNTVVLTPATADAAQAWTQVVAQITDTGNPRHPNRINVRPYRYQSPSILTQAEAQTVAGQILTKIQGTVETFAVAAMGMAALEGGDIVRVMTLDDTGTATNIVNHFLQQMTLDLDTGEMSANTQSSTELAA
jgi:hypothetical protein